MPVRPCSALVFSGLFAGLCCLTAAAQERAPELMEPGWEDPFFSNYLAREMSRPIDGAPERDAVSFSLPVLGFATIGAPGFDAAAPLEAPLGERLGAAIAEWPSCASPLPTVTTVPSDPEQAAGAAPGTWFTSTYDFGCLQIVVEGDRNTPDAAFSRSPEMTPESGAISVDYQNENAGAAIDSEGRVDRAEPAGAVEHDEVIIGYTRGNLTYGITVSCQAGSKEFCASRGALTALTGQLIPVAGRPAPN